MHAAWLAALWIWGRDQAVEPHGAVAASSRCRACACGCWRRSGTRWTTRIIVLPGAPLVAAGPYRYLSHPNYAVVAAEIALLPLALHLPWLALVFTLLNAAVLAIRIRAEARALSAIERSARMHDRA